MAKMIVGCGYLGSHVARGWIDAGQTVFAVTRSPQRAEQFERDGLRPIIADVTDQVSLDDLPAVESVLYAVGFDRTSSLPVRTVYVDGLRNVLNALADGVEKFFYISSTGVYGQTGGALVDENSPCEPTRESGRACLAAEELLREHPLGRRAIILRMAGIYGPGRVPRASDLAGGKPVAADPNGYLNLIHVEDAARVIAAVESQCRPSRTFIVSDGHPVLRRDYFAELSRLLGVPMPTFTPPPPDSRASSDKRVVSLRLRLEIDVKLKFPTYRDGLAAIITGAC